jgi:GT2 family glycosyltransferase
MDLAVIIVNWNVKNFLKGCLESIYRFTQGIEFEVFVVDNDSSDGSQEMVRTGFPQVNLIVNKENMGFAKANNQALAKCAGRYVLFLNPDTELVDNSLKAMAGFMDAHPGASAIGSKLVNSDGSPQPSCLHFPSIFTDFMENTYLSGLFPGNRLLNYYRMGYRNHEGVREIDHVFGACLFCRYGSLQDIGLFMDERFFMYYDEIDLCCRLRKNGKKVYFVPDITVVHHLNRSSKQVPVEVERWSIRSKFLYFEKHYGRKAIPFLFLNLAMRSIIVWGILSLLHSLFNCPKDINYFKEKTRVAWAEYIKSNRSLRKKI